MDLAEVVRTKQVVHISDARTLPAYLEGSPALAGIVVFSVTAVVLGARASVPAHEAKPPSATSVEQADATQTPPPGTSGTDWQNYGNTTAGTRYVRLHQLTPDNVGKLQKIWHYRTGRGGAFKATPIQIGDLLYACTGGNVIVALDAETGAERWRFDPEVKVPKIGNFGTTCRGVSYYRAPETYTGDCVERVVTATTDARMFAVDAKSGQRCASFGGNGEVNLLPGMGEVKPGFYFVTSPPTIARGRAIIGGWVMDNQETQEPSGVVRAFDVLTGRFVWAWDMGRPGVHTEPGESESYTRGTPNVWSLTSYDDKLGLVYVPTGNETSRSISRTARCAGRSRPCITTSGTTTCRRSRCCSSCRRPTARPFRRWCREPSAASCSCSIAARARRSRKCASSRCHRARCRATGPQRRSRSQSACRSSAAPISPKRTCGA
jgi:glucose dehydrogenase